MEQADDMRNSIEDHVAVYIDGVKAVTRIIDEAYKLLDCGRMERNRLELMLRELLSSKRSVRRKDFDRMMSDLISDQNRREEDVRKCLVSFIEEQGGLAERLKEEVKDLNVDMVRRINASIENGLAVTRQRILDFRNEQGMFARRLKILLGMGETLTVSDVKRVVREIKDGLTTWDAAAAT